MIFTGNNRSCARHELGSTIMRKLFYLFAALLVVTLYSCGGGSSENSSKDTVESSSGESSYNPKVAIVTLNELEEYFEVRDWDIKLSDSIKEENLESVDGKMTIKLKRLGGSELQPTDILEAKVNASVPASGFYLISADVTGQIKSLMKLNEGQEADLTFPFTSDRPFSDEIRKAYYAALTGDGSDFEKISLDIYTKAEKEANDKANEKYEKMMNEESEK